MARWQDGNWIVDGRLLIALGLSMVDCRLMIAFSSNNLQSSIINPGSSSNNHQSPLPPCRLAVLPSCHFPSWPNQSHKW
ncbi:hypothetical protein FJZ31_09225 [Candidatus Poribacteria bacterium]|nr:hypothetical protein [Candidatus Poribacteria bacterium]